MGTFCHHTIIVTSDDDLLIIEAHDRAKILFEHLTSDIIESKCNNFASFFIAPDGSKEGWETSNKFDKLREEFIKYLNISGCDYVEVIFGGGFGRAFIKNSSDIVMDESSSFGY